MIDTSNVDHLIRRLYDGCISHGSTDYARWSLRQVVDFLGLSEVRWVRDSGADNSSNEIRVGCEDENLALTTKPVTVVVPGNGESDWNRFSFVPSRDDLNDSEAQELKRLAAFIVHTDWMYRQIVQTRMAGSLRKADGQALLDQDGKILSSDTAFREMVSAERPGWNGQEFPESIDWTTAGGRSGQAIGNLRLFAAKVGDFVQLRLCRPNKHEQLSAREIEVARLIARGRTFKQAARELDVAPSTVSTHLYNLYDKLEIKGRAELIDWLSAQRDWI